MPGTFRSKNGATLAGHSDKWSNPNRRDNSHDAGQGSKGKRNQGTGTQGKLNTMPSQGIDTSKMNPEEKLKYFKSLGLMPGVKPEPDEVPQDQAPISTIEPTRNKVQALTQDLAKVFAKHPAYLSSIVQQLKSVDKSEFKKAVFAAYRAMQEVTAQSNVSELDVYKHIEDAITNSTLNEDTIIETPTMLDSLRHIWSRIFKDNPEYVDGLTDMIKRFPKEKYRNVLEHLYNVTVESEKETNNPAIVIQHIFDAIKLLRTM